MANKRPVQLFHITPSTIQHFIDLAIKVFTVTITIPATWTVASLVYNDRLEGLPLLLVKIAAVGLIDGVFLSSIWLIESRKNLADSEKFTNALIVWTLYIILLVVALLDGEGAIGLLFRAAIAIYLVRLTQATIAASMRRSEREEQAGEGQSLKWLARLLSIFLIARRMLAEFKVKFRITGTRQIANLEAIKDNAESFQMLAQDHIFMSLFEDDANKPLLSLSGPGTVNSGKHFYNLEKTESGQYVGECPVCGDKRHGDTPYSVILLIQGHLKEHSKGRTEEGTPLPATEIAAPSEPDFS